MVLRGTKKWIFYGIAVKNRLSASIFKMVKSCLLAMFLLLWLAVLK